MWDGSLSARWGASCPRQGSPAPTHRFARQLERRAELARDPFAFWAEGILSMPAHAGDHRMIELLMQYGAAVPEITKWGREYYFKRDDTAAS